MDPRFLKPCNARLEKCKLQANESKAQSETAEAVVSKTYSDSSSDSGYDESSNQGNGVENAFKKEVQPVSLTETNNEVSNVN